MYVYMLRSRKNPKKTYVGSTVDVMKRLKEHNAGRSPHTSKFLPWEIMVSIWFKDSEKALAFEKYLKIGSGHAFARRHFW